MDLRQLRYFVAVAERGSISLAAQAVHVAQPALSRQIQALEQELGTALFERTTRGVRPTAAGQQLLVDAGRLLDEAAAAKDRAQRAGRGEFGHLSIALPVMQTLAPITAAVLRGYRQQVPNVSVTLHHLLSETQLGLMASGRLDAGFLLFRPAGDPAFEAIPIRAEKMLLAYPAEWRWEQGRPQSLRDLNDVEFVGLTRSAAPAWHDTLIHCFVNAGFVPRISVQGVDAGSMLTLVAAGMGCTALPESVQGVAPATVAFLEIPDLDVVHQWELVWRTGNRSVQLRRFIDVVAQCMATLPPPPR